MTPLAPHVTAFFQERLTLERRASANTCDSYAYAFKLLLNYASKRLKVAPSRLEFEQIDARLVIGFLNDLESQRSNAASSRNVRLAAIQSFMQFMEYRLPSGLRANPACTRYSDEEDRYAPGAPPNTEEIQALLDAPRPIDWSGIRDRAMLHLCFAAGLRVSELTGLRIEDLSLHPHASILVRGKGRSERCLPLWKQTVTALRAWLAVRGTACRPRALRQCQRREPLTRAGFEYILEKHVKTAGLRCPSLAAKRISPHVLRHSCALTILEATKDLRKVSLVARSRQYANYRDVHACRPVHQAGNARGGHRTPAAVGPLPCQRQADCFSHIPLFYAERRAFKIMAIPGSHRREPALQYAPH